MKPLFALLAFAALPAAGQVAHMREPILGESTTKVSDHVWELSGVQARLLWFGVQSVYADPDDAQ